MTTWNDVRRDHGAALGRVAASYAPPGPDREDLLQKIAIALVAALPQHGGDASVKTFALRIAHNVGLRHALRRPRWAEEVEVADATPGAAAPLPGAAGRRRLRGRRDVRSGRLRLHKLRVFRGHLEIRMLPVGGTGPVAKQTTFRPRRTHASV